MKKKFLASILGTLILLSGIVSYVAAEASAEIADNEFELAEASGTCGANLEWTLDDDGVLTISGTGNMTIYSESYVAPWRYLNINSIIIEDGVGSIGNEAFIGQRNLTSITIPDSVESIGEEAFYLCKGLTNVTMSEGIKKIASRAFLDCSSLSSIIIPDSVTYIGSYAFRRCSSLESVTIGKGVASIGKYAFRECSSLTEVNYNATDCTTIGDTIFDQCVKLTEVNIGENVLAIPGDVFYRCRYLTSVTIPNGVTSIGECAFSECIRLTSVTIPDSVESIGANAFANCSELTDVYYLGTEKEWNEIVIDSQNECLTGASIHYSYVPGSIAWESDTQSITVTGSEGNTGTLIIANYSDGDLSRLESMEITFETGGMKTVSLPAGMSANGMKIFLWESLESLVPLADCIAVN